MDEKLLEVIKEVLKKDKRVIFAYLHGSILKSSANNDIDIAVFSRNNVSPHVLSADLKVTLYHRTGIAADIFDIRVINDIIETGDLFALIFLKNVFSENVLLVDRAYNLRTDFLERYGMKFRECEGLITEILS
jgi:predicted nucleotidyltransferase